MRDDSEEVRSNQRQFPCAKSLRRESVNRKNPTSKPSLIPET